MAKGPGLPAAPLSSTDGSIDFDEIALVAMANPGAAAVFVEEDAQVRRAIGAALRADGDDRLPLAGRNRDIFAAAFMMRAAGGVLAAAGCGAAADLGEGRRCDGAEYGDDSEGNEGDLAHVVFSLG